MNSNSTEKQVIKFGAHGTSLRGTYSFTRQKAADFGARSVLSQSLFVDSKLSAIKPFC